jgi:putative transposase
MDDFTTTIKEGLGVRQRVARSRELVARGRPAALVARVAGISRQAIYRRPARPPRGERRRVSATDRVVLEVARNNPTDGTRMVAAIAVETWARRSTASGCSG